ncbi:MAG: 4Fe-4S dicluster domain-containing protein [Myxococcales bacterium]|nr:4Fe-4S dicluster domain-containing protein [Myxococcales bacterium]
MAELRPYPFAALVHRMFRELRERDAIFDLPRRKFFVGDVKHDYSVSFHGQRASSALGPAAGPQSQLAQNIVLSWLAGGRIMELKTVQILDELEIPRPCIDMQTVGFNVEWSQELKLAQSLEEYVKASMLIEMLVASGELGLVDGFDDVIYDMSVGYDLAGIRSEPVQTFVRGMLDASTLIERLRGEIPDEHAKLRELDYRTRLSDTLTLSTFHGCPPDEIERIIEFLQDEVDLHCIVKLNPTLLGPVDGRRLLTETLGYADLRIPDTAYEKDTKWEQAVAFIERLGKRAADRGRGFGIKLTNTQIVENHRDFFPAKEKEMYLSGRPLHVLAMELVRRFRRQFGGSLPISFSAGIERANFPDAVAIGLTPVTVCSDLLKPGGYGRASTYFAELKKRMDKVGAADVDTFILRAYDGQAAAALDALDGLDAERAAACRAALGDKGSDLRAAAGDDFARWVDATKVRNTEVYVDGATADSRYHHSKNEKPPKKIGSHLELFDCITCDKCIPVCPNDANFALMLSPREINAPRVVKQGSAFSVVSQRTIKLTQKHQIANFADFCNECGNCDIFCPEDGGPYIEKPRFFGTRSDFELFTERDGFYVERAGSGEAHVLGRFDGKGYRLELAGARARYSGEGFAVSLDMENPAGSIEGEASVEVDLAYMHIMCWMVEALLGGEVSYIAGVA